MKQEFTHTWIEYALGVTPRGCGVRDRGNVYRQLQDGYPARVWSEGNARRTWQTGPRLPRAGVE